MKNVIKEKPRYCEYRGEQNTACKQCFAYKNNSKTNIRCQYIPLYSFDGKMCAGLWGDILVKIVEWSKHYFRKYEGWACDTKILEVAKQMGAKWVHVWDTEKNTVYEADIDSFILKGIEKNYGYSDQKILPVYFWHIVDDKKS